MFRLLAQALFIIGASVITYFLLPDNLQENIGDMAKRLIPDSIEEKAENVFKTPEEERADILQTLDASLAEAEENLRRSSSSPEISSALENIKISKEMLNKLAQLNEGESLKGKLATEAAKTIVKQFDDQEYACTPVEK